MAIFAHTSVSTTADSLQAGRELGQTLATQGRELELVLTYLTMNHDHAAYLRGLREALGERVSVLGCSAQGVVGRNFVREQGYAAGALGLGGLGASAAMVEDISADSSAKGEQLGRALLAQLSAPPKAVVLHYDALCGVDPERFVAGLYRVVECPIVGGAAAHSFNYFSLRETYQYFGGRLLARAAVAVAISGDFQIEIGVCHGCSPVGVEFEVTRAEGNILYELGGRRASDVWEEICGSIADKTNQSSALAIGVPLQGASGALDYQVRAGYFIDTESGGVTLGPSIATGTHIMLHHRTTEDVVEGARQMGRDMVARIGSRRVCALLGFECGARTLPFLGVEGTLKENQELQSLFDESVPWLGMMPWGEIIPMGGPPTFHNYSYPLLAIVE